MKKSVAIWVVTFILSLLPLTYVTAEFFKLPLIWNTLYGYLSLGFGLVCTWPLWKAVFTKDFKRTNKQDLIAVIALLLSYGYAFVSGEADYYWQPTAITSLLLVGGWIFRAQLNVLASEVRQLETLLPAKATLIDGRELEQISASDLEIGQVVLVRPGSVIPADGYVIQGSSLVSQAQITGEAEPILKNPGDWVLGGSVNVAGRASSNAPLTIRISAVGSDLLVHELDRSLTVENEVAPRFTNFSEIFSRMLPILTIAVALVAAGYQFVVSASMAAEFSVTVGVLLASQVTLVGRSVSLAAEASAIRAKNLGVLIRSRQNFEALAKINHVVFKKTGVLTKGHSAMGKIHLARSTSIGSESELLALAASVEVGTSHELGHLIIQEAAQRGLELPRVSDFAPIPGLGVSAIFDGSLVQVGNSGMVNVTGVNINPYDLFQVSTAYSEGSSVVFVSIDELLVGYIEFPDALRSDSVQTIIELSGKQAITVLSGDATALVEKFAQQLGLSDIAAEVLSTRQADWIKERQANGSKILLVADANYDAAALAEASVSLAFGAGHRVHSDSAKLILVSQNLFAVPKLIALSKKTQSRALWNVVLGLAISCGLMAFGFFGVVAPAIALIGSLFSWLLLGRIVRLVK
jgi:Cu2+-exporting ATPase